MSEQACKTPLVELLRAVPRDAVWVFNDVMSMSSYPVGRLCHEAADEIEGYRASSDIRGANIIEMQKALIDLSAHFAGQALGFREMARELRKMARGSVDCSP